MLTMRQKKVVWLKPTKGNISIGRILISEWLIRNGFDVEIYECSWFAIFKVFFKILKEDFDVVIGTTHLGLAIGGLIKILKKKKFVADFVDKYDVLFVDLKGFKKIFGYIVVLLQKFSLKVADAVVVIPKEIYEELRRKRPMVFKTNLCIDLENFRYAQRSKKILEKFKINNKKPKVIYVGHFSEVYNLDLLLKSMKFLPDFQLIMIGGGKLERDLKKLVRDLNLRNVKFLGYLPNKVVAEIMKSCDVGITLCKIPRQLKIYEYLAADLSVVVPESVLNNGDFEFCDYCIGVKLNPKDISEGIKTAVQTKVRKDNHLMALLEKYSCKIVAEMYKRVIELIGDKP